MGKTVALKEQPDAVMRHLDSLSEVFFYDTVDAALEAIERGCETVVIPLEIRDVDLWPLLRLVKGMSGFERLVVSGDNPDPTWQSEAFLAGADAVLAPPFPELSLRAAFCQNPGFESAFLDQLRVMTDFADLMSLVQTFLQSLETRTQQLKQALAAGQAETCFSLAHPLKSSSANMGGRRLSELCARIEKGSHGPDDASELSREADNLRKNLEAYLDAYRPRQ